MVYAKVAQLVECITSSDRFVSGNRGFESHCVLIFFLKYFALFCLILFHYCLFSLFSCNY